MRIKTIEITNYKAFRCTHKIAVGGKNLFIYGENGSGKSSLYYALKDFFQSTMETIDLSEVENVFVIANRRPLQARKSRTHSAPRPTDSQTLWSQRGPDLQSKPSKT